MFELEKILKDIKIKKLENNTVYYLAKKNVTLTDSVSYTTNNVIDKNSITKDTPYIDFPIQQYNGDIVSNIIVEYVTCKLQLYVDNVYFTDIDNNFIFAPYLVNRNCKVRIIFNEDDVETLPNKMNFLYTSCLLTNYYYNLLKYTECCYKNIIYKGGGISINKTE